MTTFKIALIPVILTLGLLATTTSFAKATLIADEHTQITAINGDAVNQGLLQQHNHKFELHAGRHVITARYDRLYNIGHDNHDFVRSQNITIDTNLADNQTYTLSMNAPEHYQDAKEYAKAPTLSLSNNGKTIAQKSANIQQTGILSNIGKLFGGSGVDENQQVVASLPTHTQNAPNTSAKQNQSTLDEFMALWLKASPSEREKIREWIK